MELCRVISENIRMADWKKIAGGIGAAVLVAAGSYFGLDDGGNTSDNTAQSESNSSSSSAPKPSAPKSSQQKSSENSPAKEDSSSPTGETCYVNTLPEEADEVIDRILTDQDHLYSQHDGKHFGNYEGILPQEKGDYYREYTVKTPGNKSRGARRIVVGGGTEDDPDVWYYTDDHYESFCVIPDAEG